MSSRLIRKKFLDFFKAKGHQIVPSSSLIPADPTALFTSAGMQQFVPYLSGQIKPPYQRAASCQKCFRTSDIDKVGNKFHHTFFEMLGNWSFGGYFKKEAIKFACELLNSKFQIPMSKLWITIFRGEKGIPKDKESAQLWQKAGIAKERIKEFGLKDNFWGPVTDIGPCGPCSEIHYDLGEEARVGECDIKGCGPNCACGRFTEIWNLVFMEYFKDEKGKLKKLPAKNVDTGLGLERLTAVLQKKDSDFETDLFWPVIEELERLSNKSYQSNPRPYRIIADHLRGACFLIAEGIFPGKEDRPYVLRRILRRVIRYGKRLELPKESLIKLAKIVISLYQALYPELKQKENDILTILQKEEEKFSRTLERGIKEFEKLVREAEANKKSFLGKNGVFHLYDTYGFPFELTEELAKEKGLKVDKINFEKAFAEHQQISRAGAVKKFGGLGIDQVKDKEAREKMTKLHTATHLLHQALRDVLGQHVQQMGSDISPERLRFDFKHNQKLTDEEKKKVENIVNQKIKENLAIKIEEMPFEKAIKSGALAFFKEKYPSIVKVFSIGDYSKEICAGPHIKQTNQLGKFKIVSEKSSSAGVRRIKANLE